MGTTFDVPVDVALEHHGIKGQKWGVRRFQNADGSLTAAGKERYGTNLSGKTNEKKLADKIKSHDLFTESMARENKKRATDAADLGLKALTKMGRHDGTIDEDFRDWFIYEDQTIGLVTIADQVNQGRSSKEIKHLVRDANSLSNDYEYEPGFFQLRNAYGSDEFIDACFAVKADEKKNLKHSDEDDADNYLMHFGIKGQRWGIRRFQNPDGTLTAAGRARYDTGTALKSLANNVSEHRRERFEKKKEKIVAKGNAKQVSRISSKLTTKELEDAIRRVELTQKINELRVKPTTYKFIGTIANVMRNTSTLGNSFADAADAVKRVKKLFNKVDEEAEARKKGRLAGIEEGEKLKAKNEIFPDAKRVKLKDIRGFTRTDNLNDRINSMSDKETSDITNLARSSKAARLNERIWNLSDADRDQRSPSNPNRNTESYWTQGSPRNSTSYWYTPKVSRDKKPPTVSSAVQSKTALNMRNPINLSLSLTKAGIDLKQLRKERKKTKGQSNSSTDDIGSLNDSLLSANQKKLDEYEKKKKK